MLSQAVILCGGLGTRLGALTAATPKPLLPVAGRPFLDHLIQELSRYGFSRVTLLAGQFGQLVAERYDGRRLHGLSVEVTIEPQPLGTGGALRHAADAGLFEPEFLLMNGDSWIDMNLAEVGRQWAAARRADPGVAVQLLLQTVPDAARFGRVEVAGGRVSAFREKDAAGSGAPGQINTGVYVMERGIALGLAPGKAVSLEADVLPPLVAAGRVVAVAAPEGAYFIDIGVPESYAAAQEGLATHRRRPALFLDRDGTLNVDRGYTHRAEDLDWQRDARQAVRLANDAGYYVFVVTNQAGVARGYYDEAAVEAFHRAMQADLGAIGAHVDAFAYCPHHPEGTVAAYARPCRRRKPGPGMIEDLARDWPVDLARSLMIGDTDADMGAAAAAGIRGARFTGGSLLDLVRAEILKGDR